MKHTKTTIGIVGGGFAGIRAAHLLSKRAYDLDIEITLIDRESYHFNTPIMYEIASAFLHTEKDAVGKTLHEAAGVHFEDVLDGTHAMFVKGAVEYVYPKERMVVLTDRRKYTPDILLLTLGAQTNTFNIPGVDAYAFGVKTVHEAAELRHHIVSLFLRYRGASKSVQDRVFTFLVAGGGNAGVEVAAELRLFTRKLALLHHVPEERVRVLLVEGSDTILREYPVSLRRKAVERLRMLGVDIHTKRVIARAAPDGVHLHDGMHIPTETTIWVGGIRAHDVFLRSGLPLHPRGGLLVEETLEVHGAENIFAAGDCVYISDPVTGQVVPDVAWAALHQGTFVAHNILRRIQQKPLATYLYHARPTFATVGGKYALVNMPPLKFAGTFGWVLKQLIDLWYLMSILPNMAALRSWWGSVRVRVANDHMPTRV